MLTLPEFVVFLFLYFSILFFTKIYFYFRNLQEYTPTAPLPGGRHLAGRQGLFCKKFCGKFAPGPLEDRSPDSGAVGPKAAQQRDERLP